MRAFLFTHESARRPVRYAPHPLMSPDPMSDRLPRSGGALAPLLAAYGDAPAVATGAAGHAEQEALSQMRRVLDAQPSLAPSGAAVAAVLARAAEPAPDALPAVSPSEVALLGQSLAALDRLGRPRPPADLVARVEARAAEASAAVGAVKHAYEGAAVPSSRVKASALALVVQGRDVLDRAFAARPQPRPDETTVAAILARAAEATAVGVEPRAEAAPVEAAVLAQSHRALDRLPRRRPSTEALDAVLVAAATAAATTAAPPPVTAPTAGTPATAVPSALFARPYAWVGAAALAAAALAAVVVLPLGGPAAESVIEPAAFVADVSVPEPTGEEEAVEAAPAAPLAAVAPALVQETRRVPSGPAPSEPPAPRRAARVAAAPSAATITEPTPSWDPTDDVRTLTLRFDDIDEDDLGWDEPAEAFGAPATRAGVSSPGVRVVREGAAPARSARPAPARPDSTQR